MGGWRQHFEPTGDAVSLDELCAIPVRALQGDSLAVVLEWQREAKAPLAELAGKVLRRESSQRGVLRRGALADGTRFLVLRQTSANQHQKLADPSLREEALRELLAGRARGGATASGHPTPVSSSGAVRQLIKPAPRTPPDLSDHSNVELDSGRSPVSSAGKGRPREPKLILDMPHVEPVRYDESSRPSGQQPLADDAPESLAPSPPQGRAALRRAPWATLAVVAAGVVLGATGALVALERVIGDGESGEVADPPAVGPEAGLDGGPVDAGPMDAGPMDTGPMDAGPVDAGPALPNLPEGPLARALSESAEAGGPGADAGLAHDLTSAADGGLEHEVLAATPPDASVLILRDVPAGAEVRIEGAEGTLQIVLPPETDSRVRVLLDGHRPLEVVPPPAGDSAETDVVMERETRAQRRARQRREARRRRRGR